MSSKRTNDTDYVENFIEESTPTKKVKKSENLVANHERVKASVEQPKKQRGRPKKVSKSTIGKKEITKQKIKEPTAKENKRFVENNKHQGRLGRPKKITETKAKKELTNKKQKVVEAEKIEEEEDRIAIFDSEEEDSEKEEEDSEKEEEDSEKEEEEQIQKEGNKSNSSLKKFDFDEFANTKDKTQSSDEEGESEDIEESLAVPEVQKVFEVETKSKRSKGGRPKKPITDFGLQTSNSPKPPKASKKTSSKKIEQKLKPVKTTKKAVAKKDKAIEEEQKKEEDSFEQQLVEPSTSDDKKTTRQTRKTKHNQLENKSLETNSKGKAKSAKGSKLKLTDKPIEEDLFDKEEKKIETKPKSSKFSAKKMSKKSVDPFKIISLNCAGVRAAVKKDLVKFMVDQDANIVCLQEIKCTEDQMPEELKDLDYHIYWSASEDKSNQSGVATFTKIKPVSVTYGIGSEIHDREGRAITCEFDNFYLVNVYATNASRRLVNLKKKRDWNAKFKNFLMKLDEKKPVIACGDFNCAHKEIDLKNPKTNVKNAGFTPEEREDFTELLESGFFDSFRHLYPDQKDAYTFWSNMNNSRANNVGWRLDYFILSNSLQDALIDNVINNEEYLSDHCPITLLINV